MSSRGRTPGHTILNLRKFDISSIASDKVVVMLGKRGTGKSVCVADLLYYNRDIPVGTVISPTEAVNKFFSDIVPSLFIHDDYTPALIARVVKRQVLAMRKSLKEKAAFGASTIDPRAFLLMDDCLHDDKWKQDKNIRFLFFNGRHIQCLFIFTMQHPLGVPPSLRTNIDYVFVFREPIISNRKKLYESYCGIFPTFSMFCEVLDACTDDHQCLVINNTVKSNRLEDIVSWYRADIHPPFKIGANEFWKAHYELSAQGGDDDIDDLDDLNFETGKGSKAGSLVTVRKTL